MAHAFEAGMFVYFHVYMVKKSKNVKQWLLYSLLEKVYYNS